MDLLDDHLPRRRVALSLLSAQFLKDVDWGPLDYLVIDAPPGTSDEHISLAQYLNCGDADGALIVTGPQVRRRGSYLSSSLDHR